MALFPGRRFRQVCYTIMVVTSLYLVSVICEAFVFCRPVQYNWDTSIPGSCDEWSQSIAFTVAGSTNLVIDTIVVTLPMRKIFGLNMTLTKKLSVVSMFSLGALLVIEL